MNMLWRLLPAVRRPERGRFLFFAGLYALISLAQTLGLSGSEALFLSRLGADALPAAFILASGVAVAGSLAYAAVVARVRNDRLFVAILLIAAAWLFTAAAWLPEAGGATGALLLALFCSFYLAEAVFLTHYRTLATDFFDTLAAKRLLPSFAVGASSGGALGGLLAVGLSRVGAPELLIVGWAVALCGAAGMLLFGRRKLRGWVPVGLAERDESSVEGLRGALRYLGRSTLSRWLALSVVGMVFSLSILHYLYSRIFVDHFPDASDLAAFFGIYLALSNLLEVGIVLFVTPRVLTRFGVTGGNLIHPVLTILTFLSLAVRPLLGTAVLARANRELVENALAGEIRNLSYNALPSRFRGSLRALLEGMFFYAAMSIAGVTLMAAGDSASLRWLAAIGVIAALGYGLANWRVRGEYVNSLAGELREGRLDLARIGAGLSNPEMLQLARQWETLVAREGDRPSQGNLDMVRSLAARGLFEPLLRAVEVGSARLRQACLEALAGSPLPPEPDRLSLVALRALEASDASVRRAAVQVLGALSPLPGRASRGLRESLEDPDPSVCAAAAAQLGRAGHDALCRLARSRDPKAAIAALECLPKDLLGEARARLCDPLAAVRAAALSAVARCADGTLLPPAHLQSELAHADPIVRRAAVRAIAAAGSPDAAPLLAGALDDPDRWVRSHAVRALAQLGEAGVRAAEPMLAGIRLWTDDAVLCVLADSRTTLGRQCLHRAFAERVRDAWRFRLALEHVRSDESLALRFLQAALENALVRSRRLAFRVLELIEDPALIRNLLEVLRSNRAGDRGDALEVLSNLGPREDAQLLVLLLEDEPLADRLSGAAQSVPVPPDLEQVVADSAGSKDRWLRLAGNACSRGDAPGESEEQTIMERILALREVAIFSQLSLDQLEAIGGFMQEVHFMAGDVVMREGEPANELFVLMEGAVQAIKDRGGRNELLLNTLTPVSYFGEIALLDNALRSATIVVSRDARALSLDGERFKELILQAPEIAFDIFRVLTARLRAAEARHP